MKQYLHVKPKMSVRQASAPEGVGTNDTGIQNLVGLFPKAGLPAGVEKPQQNSSGPWPRCWLWTEDSWRVQRARSQSCPCRECYIVMSQLARASQIPNFMPFMNNCSMLSAQLEELKTRNIVLPASLLKMITEDTMLCN